MNVRTYSGTLAAAQDAVTALVDDEDEVSIQAFGTWTGTAVFEVSIDGTNFVSLAVVPYDSVTPGTPVVSATAVGAWYARNITTARAVRVRESVLGTGALTVTIIAGRLGRA